MINRKHVDYGKLRRTSRKRVARKEAVAQLKNERVAEAFTRQQRRMILSNPNANIQISKKKARLIVKRMKKLNKEVNMKDSEEVELEAQEESNAFSMDIAGSGSGTVLGAPSV